MSKKEGFTGLSIFHRLHKLYGFDFLRDMVFDEMHNIALNGVSNHLHYYIEKRMLPNVEVAK